MNNQLREVVISNVIGVVLIIAGILLNEWILSFLFSEDKELELLTNIIIWTFDILCLLALIPQGLSKICY